MPPKKMGRPPSANPKRDTLRTRVDADTVRKLNDCIRTLNMNRSDVVRKGIDMVRDSLDK